MKPTTLVAAFAAISLLSLAACGGGGGSSTPVVQPPDPPVDEPEPPVDEPEPELPADDLDRDGEPPREVRSPPGTPELDVPPLPQFVEVVSGIEVVQLLWANPWNYYVNHGLTRIYRNTVNDFATAAEVGTSSGISYTDDMVRGGQTYFYWLRWETDTGTAGPVAGSEDFGQGYDPVAQWLLEPVGTIAAGSVQAWGIWARDGNETTLFRATINASRASQSYASYVFGDRSFSNPTSGSATWSGDVRGITEEYRPVEGDSEITFDFATVSVDVHFTGFDDGRADMSWNDVSSSSSGRFSSGSELEGAFFGDDHEGVAGKFDRDGLRGVFGAIRE